MGTTWIVRVGNQEHIVRRSKKLEEFKANLSATTNIKKFRLLINGEEIKNQNDFNLSINERSVDIVADEIVEWTVKTEDREYIIERCDKFKKLKMKISETVKMYNFSLKIDGHEINRQKNLDPYIEMRNIIIEVTEIVEWKIEVKRKNTNKTKNKKISIHRCHQYNELMNRISEKVKIDDFILKIRGNEIKKKEDFNIYVKMRNVIVEISRVYWELIAENTKYKIRRYNEYENLMRKIKKKTKINDFSLKIEENEIKSKYDFYKYANERNIILEVKKNVYWTVEYKGEPPIQLIIPCDDFEILKDLLKQKYREENPSIYINEICIDNQENFEDNVKQNDNVVIKLEKCVSGELDSVIKLSKGKVHGEEKKKLSKELPIFEEEIVAIDIFLEKENNGEFWYIEEGKEGKKLKRIGKRIYDKSNIENSINSVDMSIYIIEDINHDINENNYGEFTQTVTAKINDTKHRLTKHEHISGCYTSNKPLGKKFIGVYIYNEFYKLAGYISHLIKELVYVKPILSLIKDIKEIKAHKEALDAGKGKSEKINIKSDYVLEGISKPVIQPEEANPPRSFYSFFHYYNKDFSLNQIIIYQDLYYKLDVINTDLTAYKGATYTTTPHGLIIVFENIAYKVTKKTKKLRELHHKHVYHSSVWHKNKLYVISGERCKEVEYLDINMNWQRDKPLPQVAKKNAAVCSVNNSIYLMAGRDDNMLSNSVLKFTEDWEVLNWISPWKYEGMGLLTNNNSFILFGGKNERGNWNYKFCEIDFNGKKKIKGYLMETGFFSNKSFGFIRNKKYLFINQSKILEFSNGFKLVSIE